MSGSPHSGRRSPGTRSPAGAATGLRHARLWWATTRGSGRFSSVPGVRTHGASAADALGEEGLLVEPAVGREWDRLILGLAPQVRVGADLVLEPGRDPEGVQLQGVGDQHQARLARVDPPAGLERGLEDVTVGRERDRDPGTLEHA